MAAIDVVRWVAESGLTVYAYRYPETNLSTYTQLIVQESQEAVLFSKGKIVGKFGPGKHTLNTENLPILRSLMGLPFGGKNPFTAEVWFVNMVQVFDIDWKVDRMDIHDADYNTGIPLVASGKYGLKLTDAERFLVKIVGTKSTFDEAELTRQFKGEFVSKTKSALMQFMLHNKVGLKQISAYLDNISDHLLSLLRPFWENIGFELTKFYTTSVEIDSTSQVGQRVLDAISRQSAQSIAGYTWQQSQAFEVAKGALDVHGTGNSGGLAPLLAFNLIGGMGGQGGGSIMQPPLTQATFGTQPTFAPNQPIQGVPSESQQTIKAIYCANCAYKYNSNQAYCPKCGNQYRPCPSCGTDNEKNAKRCVSCGQGIMPQSKPCVFCNQPMPIDAGFCGNCGKQQSDDNCTRCSAKLSPSDKFCPKCGFKR